MALDIQDPETERLARALSERTGESVAVATRRALEERLRRLASEEGTASLLDDMAASRRRWKAMPIRDGRPPDEILDFDADGLPR